MRKRTFREWLEDHQPALDRWTDFVVTISIIAVAAFIGASAARVVFP